MDPKLWALSRVDPLYEKQDKKKKGVWTKACPFQVRLIAGPQRFYGWSGSFSPKAVSYFPQKQRHKN